MKHNQQFSHFSLRGLESVQAESYLYMLAYNLRKMGTVGVLRPLSSLIFSLYSLFALFAACFGRILARWAIHRADTENRDGFEKKSSDTICSVGKVFLTQPREHFDNAVAAEKF